MRDNNYGTDLRSQFREFYVTLTQKILGPNIDKLPVQPMHVLLHMIVDFKITFSADKMWTGILNNKNNILLINLDFYIWVVSANPYKIYTNDHFRAKHMNSFQIEIKPTTHQMLPYWD